MGPIDRTLTDIPTPDQKGLEINGSEEILQLPRSPELEPHYKMQFCVIHWTPLFGGGLTPL